jgi:hypothetical protein
MKTNRSRALDFVKRWSVAHWKTCRTALIAFATGSLITGYLSHVREVRAENVRVYELNIYHAVPGKVPKLEARFEDASKLLAAHHLNVLGYWVPNDDPAFANTFVYLLVHPSREEAEKNWGAFHADPAFQKYRQAENAEKLIEHVDSTYMRATNYSAMK